MDATDMYDYSVIVPLLGRISEFEDTLASVLRHRPPQAQVIVAHDGRYDDPHGLQSEVQFVTADPHRNLAGLLNAAIRTVQGHITVLIRPGIEIDEGFDQPIAEAFVDSNVASVCPLIVISSCPS